ncbi:hypothetical protein WN51_13974 [Melipona quadrifasciata]|uniref:Uncharacterized protein n=1 Tax=Melipona quadrifasciata TaxID=166423 RepID=A0A0M9A0K3_9HYME|nr:hypothetical protein WN51_13974 [Melipona quadrifasciata]
MKISIAKIMKMFIGGLSWQTSPVPLATTGNSLSEKLMETGYVNTNSTALPVTSDNCSTVLQILALSLRNLKHLQTTSNVYFDATKRDVGRIYIDKPSLDKKRFPKHTWHTEREVVTQSTAPKKIAELRRGEIVDKLNFHLCIDTFTDQNPSSSQKSTTLFRKIQLDASYAWVVRVVAAKSKMFPAFITLPDYPDHRRQLLSLHFITESDFSGELPNMIPERCRSHTCGFHSLGCFSESAV